MGPLIIIPLLIKAVPTVLQGLQMVGTLRDAKDAKLGRFLVEKAKALGWKSDSGEGAYEYVTRKGYEQGLEDGRKQGILLSMANVGEMPYSHATIEKLELVLEEVENGRKK